jgi:hypothetical protein
MSTTAGVADADAAGAAETDIARTSTGLGKDRVYQSAAPPSNAINSAARASSSPRESIASRSRMEPSDIVPPRGVVGRGNRGRYRAT